jgi:hypothetical protein
MTMNKIWSEREMEILKDCYNDGIAPFDIAVKLNRTIKAVKNKAWKLKITNNPAFTNKEKEYIKANYIGTNLKQIAKDLGREKNYQNVCRVAKGMGLTDIKRKKWFNIVGGFKKGCSPFNATEWTVEKIEYLLVNYKVKSYRELVLELDISEEVIRRKLKALNLKKVGKNETIWTYKKHPQGMQGKTHTPKIRKQLSKAHKKLWETKTKEEIDERTLKSRATRIKNGTLTSSMNRKNPYSRARGGRRKDLGNIYFRSRWEANIARYYNLLGVSWQYEPKTFVFDTIKRGSVSYTPDFYLDEEDQWVEVKGWMDSKSKTKLRRFKKYYPGEYAKLEIIDESRYKAIAKDKGAIPNWE